MLCELDLELLRKRFINARPVPYIMIDSFLDRDAADKVADSYPAFEAAVGQGKEFTSVNERKKVQITRSSLFPGPVAQLSTLLASQKVLDDLSFITGIPNLIADESLSGGGMHITGAGGRLDVHVDFNYIKGRALHRRLNLLVYLNPNWQEDWGGQFQLWDKEVKNCEVTFSPVLNRCVIFETSDVSFHGVVPVSAKAKAPRRSFAVYYYTKEAPDHWTGEEHSTIFVARPEERFKRYIAMPADRLMHQVHRGKERLKTKIKSLIGRD
jgi:hypothetical protein